jgi:hypothetical protein
VRQALELALEALEVATTPLAKDRQEVLRAITAIKEALAQPEQEPLEYWNAVEGWVKIDEVREHFDSVGCATIYKTAGEGRVPLSLALAQPEQEPVAVVDVHEFYDNCANFSLLQKLPKGKHTLYTTPPQRTWVGLTDEEIADCAEKMEASDPTDSFWREFFRGIEAKLKEKNT